MLFQSVAFLLLAMAQEAQAWPGGAGQCLCCQAATTGVPNHEQESTVVNEGLGDLFKLDIGGDDLKDTTEIMVGEEITLTLSVDKADYFKGFLFRFSPPSTEGKTVTDLDEIMSVGSVDGLAQPASACEGEAGVIGITHTDNSEKLATAVTIVVDEAVEGMALDLTIVTENSSVEMVSETTYARFLLTAVEEGMGDPMVMVEAGTMSPTEDGSMIGSMDGSGEDALVDAKDKDKMDEDKMDVDKMDVDKMDDKDKDDGKDKDRD